MATNDKNLQVVTAVGQESVQCHPEYQYWAYSWEVLRDTIIGEIAVKSKGSKYLRQMEAQNNDEYSAFLDRAYFYNMTQRTVAGLCGTIFRREPKVKNLPKQFDKGIKSIAKDGSGLNTFIRDTANEVLSVGRTGVLLDMDKNGRGTPFLVNYIAENILDWSVVEIDGRYVLKEVLLREIEEDRDSFPVQLRTSSLRYKALYRKLRLDDDGVYRQYVYRTKFFNMSMVTDEEPEVIEPTRLGVPFNFIPFVFFGPYSNNPQVEKPPVIDIALMNLSHYQSVAQLEHGRFYTAIPIYHVQVKNQNDKGGDYVVGPNVVWEYEGDKAPGIAEYNGQGLIFLERALEEKEANISAMGGRMLGTKSTAVAESDNLVKVKEKNEMSLLLNLTNSLNEGFTKLITWWLYWQNENLDTIDAQVEVNRDFLFAQIDAREFRAFTMMYQENIIPIDVLFDILQKTDVMPDSITVEEFKAMLENPDQFPNNPDFEARREGYPDAKTKVEIEGADRDRTAAQNQLKMTQSFQAQENKLNRNVKKTKQL
jgi:hypothetical protein